MFELSTSQRSRDGEVGVDENHTEMCRWLWVYQSLTLKCISRVFSLKTTPYTFPNRDFRETVAKIIAWHDSSSFSHMLYMWLFCRLLLARHSRTRYEIHLIIFWSLILHRSLTLIPYNQTDILTSKKIEEITIKFGKEPKPTQYSWKSQLYKMYRWFLWEPTRWHQSYPTSRTGHLQRTAMLPVG